jgi:hypothetical protein
MEKTMKKKIAAVALVFSLATVGIASAQGGSRYGREYQNPSMQGQMYQQVDKATRDKLDTFFGETKDLRKQIMMKQSERQALMQSDNPNPLEVSKISGELFDLQTTMQDKAKAAGLDTYLGGPCMGMGMMGGRGGGRGMGMGCRF